MEKSLYEPKSLYESEQIEQEFAELHDRIDQTLPILDNLVEIQSQFRGIMQTYNTVRKLVDEAASGIQSANQAKTISDRRFAELEQVLGSTIEKIEEELLVIRRELTSTESNLAEELTTRVNALKGQLEKQSAPFTHLDAQISVTRSYLRDMNKQQRVMRNGLAISLLMSALALTYPILVFFSNSTTAN
ncbi:MAG: hypothetical protein F6K19_41080 [Cyanothece sp. SIO1E1]|nr:hypothetical protein [Cyanothece sp. SIO1E1]